MAEFRKGAVMEDASKSIVPLSLTRRGFLGRAAAVGTGVLGVALAACGGSAPASSAAAKPSSAPASAGASPAPASAGGQAAGEPKDWDSLLAAAKKEGKLVVTGAPDVATRQKLPVAFKQRYGIDMEYLPEATSVTARMQSERAASQYTVDVVINGSDSVYGTMWPNGWMDPIKPILVGPDVTDDSKWRTGKPWFGDPRGDTVLRLFSTASHFLTLNADIVPPDQIPNGDALLDPKWKGKIAGFDPSVNGTGLATGSALYVSKGKDWVTKLYKGQNVTLTRDYQQGPDWVAHGAYPIGLAIGYNYLDPYMKSGIKFAQPTLPDIQDYLGAGYGLLCLINKAPHPNAAKVFVNWMASKEGTALYAETQGQVPVRNDIEVTWVPADFVPKTGVKYLDTYDYEFLTKERLPIRDFYTSLLK
jgi:iron(III) transport system substrate-binding protein